MDMLKKQPLVQPEWDEHLFSRITESLTVHSNKKAEVCLISGVRITVDIPWGYTSHHKENRRQSPAAG